MKVRMHYYQHHIGDFIKDTSFLTNEEVGIYLKLIWLYYDTENPLPNDLFTLSMKINARDNQDAVEGILKMFFDLKGGFWVQSRCEKEILEYQNFINDKSKAGKASAAKRALNKSSSDDEQVLNISSSDEQLTTNHKPITNNHKPKREVATVVACPPDVDNQVWEDWKQLRKAKKAPVTQTVVDSARKESAKANMSLSEFLKIWCARGSQGLQADWLKTNNSGLSKTGEMNQRVSSGLTRGLTGGLASVKLLGK